MPNLQADKKTLSKYVKKCYGKDYLQVDGRVFAAHDARQFVSLVTMLEETETHYRFKATVTILNSHLPNYETLPESAKLGRFMGCAQSPKKGGKSAEQTKFLEIAETRAVGRALRFAGFGGLESIASFEDVAVAQPRSGMLPTKPAVAQKKALYELAQSRLGTKSKEEFAAAILAQTGKALANLTSEDVSALVDELKDMDEQKGVADEQVRSRLPGSRRHAT